MANNREISQFAGLVTVDDSTNNVSLGSTLNIGLSGGGKLGIGVTSPNANLHVGNAIGSGDAVNPAIQIGGANTYRLGFYTDNETGYIDAANGDNGLAIHTKTAGETVRITSGGTIGINTTSAADSATVQIRGSSDGVLNLDTSDTRGSFIRFKENGTSKCFVGCAEGLITGTDQDDLGLRAADNVIIASGGGTERARFDGSGNFCLGVNSTTHKIQVQGNARIVGVIRAGVAAQTAQLRELASSAGNTAIDTGLSVNQSNGGATMLVLATRNTSDGTSGDSAIYRLQFYITGNNNVASTFISGDVDFVTFGKSASNTLTVNCSSGNWTVAAVSAGYNL